MQASSQKLAASSQYSLYCVPKSIIDMIKPISPVVKGLITAIVMILVTLAIFSSKVSPGSPLQFLPIIIYAIGMVWNMITYRRTPAFNYKFGNAFGQGFRFFIVVTLMMVLFTTIFFENSTPIQRRRGQVVQRTSYKRPEQDTSGNRN